MRIISIIATNFILFSLILHTLAQNYFAILTLKYAQ